MRVRYFLSVVVALAATAMFAGSAHAALAPGTWNFDIESYSTQISSNVWRYDYVVWYEQWNATTDTWDAMGTNAGTYSNPSLFELHFNSNPASWISSTGTAPTSIDNSTYNGAVDWANAQIGPDTVYGHTGYAATWYAAGQATSEADAPGSIDYGVSDGYDPSVRTTTNAWEQNVEAAVSAENPIGQTTLCPYTPATPYDATNTDMTSLTGYNRPLGWFWLYANKPPAPIESYTVDGGISSQTVCGPTPELNSLILLLLTLLPAGVAFRRKRNQAT